MAARRIGDLIDVLPESPPRVLYVGGAAMTLARYVAALRPRSAEIVLEPSVAVIQLVRAEAQLPPRSGIKVRPVDDQACTAAVRDGSQDPGHPGLVRRRRGSESLTSAAFVAEVRRVLAPGGVFAANLIDLAVPAGPLVLRGPP